MAAIAATFNLFLFKSIPIGVIVEYLPLSLEGEQTAGHDARRERMASIRA
jgi:hypothetical protein